MRGSFMKIMNMFRIVLASAVVIAMQVDAAPKKGRKAKTAQPKRVAAKAAVEAATDEARQDVESATSQAAEQITAATLEKNRAILAGLEGTMSQDAVEAVVAEQDAIIAQVKLNLMQLAENAVAAVDNAQEQAGYVSRFMTGVQQFGAQVWNPATEQEKDLARAMVARLEQAKGNTNNPVMIQKLDEQIAEQKVITGDKMSTRQLLLLGAVTAAAAVAGYTGYALGSKYFQGEEKSEFAQDWDATKKFATKTAQKTYSAMKRGASEAVQALTPGWVAGSESTEPEYGYGPGGKSSFDFRAGLEAGSGYTEPVYGYGPGGQSSFNIKSGLEAGSVPTEVMNPGYGSEGSSIYRAVRAVRNADITPAFRAVGAAADVQSANPMTESY